MFNSKTITVTQEAYNALLKEKKSNETVSETILRLTKNHKTPSYFGTRAVTPQEFRCTSDDGWYNSSDLL